MAISTEIQRLQIAKADIKSAIEEKGVTVPSSTKLDGYADLVDQIQQGGGQEEAPENDVIFYDYDGFRVASYTIAEAKALTTLPTPPTHQGLTFQGWNWTLTDIQSYNRKYINVGANYVPTDGKTHIKFCPKVAGTSLYFLNVATTKNKPIVMDWGDGQSTERSASTDGGNISFSHTYEESGEYDVTMYSKNGDCTFGLGFNISSNGLKYIEEINTGSEQIGITLLNLKCEVSVAKQLTDYIILNRAEITLFVVPREIQWDFSSTDCLNNAVTITCFPKVVPSFAGTRVYGMPSDCRSIIPEVASGGVFAPASIASQGIVRILSLPLNFQYSSQPATNVYVGFYSLHTLDIAQGWVPNYSLSFAASTMYDSFSIVDFFNKLGTTTNAITLTFGTTNLNKLTADEKAIATNKGYTLA